MRPNQRIRISGRGRMILAAVSVTVMLAARLASVAASQQRQAPRDASAPLAVVGPRTIRASDLDRALGNRLLALQVEEYRHRRQALDELVAGALLDREAARRGISVPVLVEREVDGKTRRVTDDECRAALERSRGNFEGMGEAQALSAIAETMRRQLVAVRRQQFIDELKRTTAVSILLQPPRIAVGSAGASARGPATAPVTIVAFTDFQCPYCAQMSATLQHLQATYGDRLRLVVRHFPLPMHADAAKAAEAAVCAGRQGRFWEMHDRLFADQQSLTVVDLKRQAAALGLDPRAFDSCLDSGEGAGVWQKDRADGERYGVSGTPALFINGRPVFGLGPLSELTQLIDEELTRASSGGASR